MNIRDVLYQETDDACAICGVRGTQILTVHHIDGNKSNNKYDNQIVLCHNCHNQHHQTEELSREQIEDRKRHLIEKTLTIYGVNAMKISLRNNFGVVAMPFLLYHVVELGYLTKEEDQIGYGEQHDATARFAIIQAGKRLVREWFR